MHGIKDLTMPQAGKPRYLIANWKSHKTWPEVEAFLQQFRGFREEGSVVNIICPPFPYLKLAADTVNGLHLPIKIGAQDVSPYPFGAYTGAVSAGMLLGIAQFGIVGHSERRRYFSESNQDVVNKANRLLEVNITPVVCVDEPYMETQIAAFEPEHLEKVIFAYEPLEAIGSGEPATAEKAAAIAKKIRTSAQANMPVLYGGSVTAETIGQYMKNPALDGALVGGASMKVDSWKDLLHHGSI
jgi:triosephosphate isomerase (TIM)